MAPEPMATETAKQTPHTNQHAEKSRPTRRPMPWQSWYLVALLVLLAVAAYIWM